jgi:hypothetical protein
MESSIDIGQLTKEVLVSSDMYGQTWNICVWDYNTGTNLQSFKNCSTIPQGLEFLEQNYMLAAPHNKPYLLYWNLKGKVKFHFISFLKSIVGIIDRKTAFLQL